MDFTTFFTTYFQIFVWLGAALFFVGLLKFLALLFQGLYTAVKRSWL